MSSLHLAGLARWLPILVLGCARAGALDATAPSLPAEELDDLPAASVAVIRLDLRGAASAPISAALTAASADGLGCLGRLLPSLARVTVALVPRGRDFAAIMLLEGSLTEDAVRTCSADLARALAVRAPPEGSSPAVAPAGRSGASGPARFVVALDGRTEEEPRGLRGPMASALARAGSHPVAVVVAGGAVLRGLSTHAITYLPLSSMGEAADRIVTVAYTLDPLPAGGAAATMEAVVSDPAAAESLARQIGDVGRIVSLPGDGSVWAGLRGRIRSVSARVTGEGRTLEAAAVLTPEGLRDLVL